MKRRKQIRNAARRQRLAEQVTLHLVAAVPAQERLLLERSHALGHGVMPSALPMLMMACAIAWSSMLLREVANEGSIDLDGVDRELLHQRHRGVTGAEVVDGERHASASSR